MCPQAGAKAVDRLKAPRRRVASAWRSAASPSHPSHACRHGSAPMEVSLRNWASMIETEARKHEVARCCPWMPAITECGHPWCAKWNPWSLSHAPCDDLRHPEEACGRPSRRRRSSAGSSGRGWRSWRSSTCHQFGLVLRTAVARPRVSKDGNELRAWLHSRKAITSPARARHRSTAVASTAHDVD